jgi:hypothetical protein
MLTRDFHVVCPCCDTKILVDHKTGAVVTHEVPVENVKKSKKTFEDMLADDKKRKSEAEDVFAQAVREHEHREELLEKKFKEAMEKAEKDKTPPPPRPFEFD